MRARAGLALILITITSLGTLWSLQAQPEPTPTPEVRFLSPQPGAILRGAVEVAVEGENFVDLKTFGYAEFAYSADGVEFTPIGIDRDSFDGLSVTWDTRPVPDGAYLLQATITDLVNNRGVGRIEVFVNNRGNRSLTNEMARRVGRAFEALAELLDFPPDLTLNAAVSTGQARFEAIAALMEETASSLSALVADLPETLLQADPLLREVSLFERMNGALQRVEEGLVRFDLEETQAGLEELAELGRALAREHPDGLDFSSFAAMADGLEQAAAKANELLEIAQNPQSVESEELAATLNEFFELARQAAVAFQDIAKQLLDFAARCEVRFLQDGRTAVRFLIVAGEGKPLHLEFGCAQSGAFRLFDGSGAELFGADFVGGRLTWEGADQAGEPLGPGTYFFRVVAQLEAEGPESELVQTGRLVLDGREG